MHVQDAVVMGRFLRGAVEGRQGDRARGLGGLSVSDISTALRRYEREREERVFPLQLKSYLFGAALQIPFAPVRSLCR